MGRMFAKKDGTISVYEKPTGNREGRKSKFNDSLVAHAITLSKIGLMNMEISKELGIPWGTFGNWIRKFPEFAIQLNENRNGLLKDAQKCLGLRIKGYSYKEMQIKTEEIGGIKKTEKRLVEKHYPPDVKAAIYVLDKRSKYFRRQPEAIDELEQAETFNVYITQDKPNKDKKSNNV